jgi:hypothetical protein
MNQEHTSHQAEPSQHMPHDDLGLKAAASLQHAQPFDLLLAHLNPSNDVVVWVQCVGLTRLYPDLSIT